MKKFIFFLIVISSFIFLPNVAHAKTNMFYESNFIDGIYMSKYDPSTKTTFYQAARFFKNKNTNKIAYCLEPFTFFERNTYYNETYYPENLSETQRRNISAIAHYGYGYGNHTEEKWYPITQMLIWQEVNPNGDYYFTDSLNGNRINIFQQEMQELKKMVEDSYLKPSFHNQTYYVLKDKPLVIEDTNNLLNLYYSIVDYAKIEGNKLTITDLQLGRHEFSFNRIDNKYGQPAIFYYSDASQDLLEVGNLDYTFCKLYVYVQTTKVTLNKIDKDTKSTTPTGEATLEGAVYELYDSNMKKIKEITLENNKAILENLDFGTYYLKEIKAGKGYTISKDLIKFTLNKDNTLINLELKNEVIKNKVQIYKEYGENDNFYPEANIQFNIYNSKKKLIKTITTNQKGYAEITLPYGKYYIEQNNTTEGFEKVKPFTVEIKNETPIIYRLKNYKIKVPNTKIKANIFETIISLIKKLLC